MFLLIHTALDHAQIALCAEGKVLLMEENRLPKEHASWLHPAVQHLLATAQIQMNQLQAVAVTAGPGSYTGLRVGMAAAKGFCFALRIPLITVNTLELMAEAMIPEAKNKKALICPMLDARRQEVYTAVYSVEGKVLLEPCALILDKTSFDPYLAENKVIFAGSGAEKWEGVTDSPQAIFIAQPDVIQSFAEIVQRKSAAQQWADAFYAEPIYLKEFHTHAKI
jgi:tRNA threonylcarbamoyladenosine biosynthesis protein TsaB